MSILRILSLAGIVALTLFSQALAADPPEIACEGVYDHHLQGIATNAKDTLYWSFTTTLVKTDLDGKLLVSVPVKNHHGDLCFADGKLYVAYSNQFNKPGADSKVYIYNAGDLSLLGVKDLPQVTFGAGGMEHRGGHFFIVGGLPPDETQNYVYEYDGDFNHVTTRVIKSGYTRLGIQAVCFHDGCWWFGCYGDRGLLKADASLTFTGGYKFYAGIGLVGWSDRRLLVARHFGRQTNGHWQAKAVWVRPDEKEGMVLD